MKVLEAAGHNGEDRKVWDDTLKEAFVKIEIRGGARTVKKQTSTCKVSDNVVNWEEQLALEHLDGAGELRILLCRPKPAGERGSSIIAACGIYMRDILDAVPIDKYFELFKPGEGLEGGFIRISMNYLRPDQVRNVNGLLQGSKKKGSLLPKVLLTAAVVAGGAFAYKTYQEKNGKKEEEPKKKGGWGKK